MIFIILNAALAAYLIWASLNVNTKKKNYESRMINILLYGAIATFSMMVVLICIIYRLERIVMLLEHLQIFLISAIFIETSLFFVTCMKDKITKFDTVVKILLLLLAAFISFSKINMEEPFVFSFNSTFVLTGNLAQKFPITWLHLYIIFFIFLLPTSSFIIMLLNAENANSKMMIQSSLLCFCCVIFAWLGLTIIYYISNMLPMMRSLYMYILSVMSVMILGVMTQEKVYDGALFFSSIFSVVIKYFIPAIIGAFLYVWLKPISSDSEFMFSLFVFLGIFFMMLIGRFLTSGLSKFLNYRSIHYDEEFEKALASIDYENELSNISMDFLKAFKDNLKTTSMVTLIDNGTEEYQTVFDSEGNTYSIVKNEETRDVLLNNSINILFRSEIDTNYLLKDVRESLHKVFDETESEVLIFIHEGRHILGFLLLGEKRSGASYDEYDKHVLDKLYSYFFVYGYYMRNIANASVVGTVNREIRMSSQIITSIQENMDYINNPKVDVGYLMVPAHNIGGEFVDLIRLNDTSHIMVIGSLSGKGISASMSMVILKSIIRTFLADTHDFKKLIQKVNAFIRFSLPSGTFFSGVFCLLDFETDTMYYVNCGIPTMLEYSKTYNNLIEIQGKGYVLGFVKDVTPLIKVKQIKLVSGDMLAISTNGLINSHSLRGEQFGKERIKQAIMDNYTYPATRIARFAFDNLQKFMSKELEDDITLVVLKYFGKDALYSTDSASSSQETISDHQDDFDPEALIDNAIDETEVTEQIASSIVSSEEQISDESVMVDENLVVDQNDLVDIANESLTIDSEALNVEGNAKKLLDDELSSDDMFNFDFSSIQEEDN